MPDIAYEGYDIFSTDIVVWNILWLDILVIGVL
jgi:hypothetical protein